jgi:hypothetical protein
MSDQFQPKELQGTCLLGAITLPNPGHLGGRFVRHRTPLGDTLTSQNFQHHLDYPGKDKYPEVSQRLKSVVQGGGGLICEPNNRIGAPMCTFLYGGISPGAAHPLLNLVQGPSGGDQLMINGQEYNPNFARQATTGDRRQGGPDPITSSTSPFEYPGVQFPQIPSATVAPFNASKVNTTFNIWQLSNLPTTDLGIYELVGNFGPAPIAGLTSSQATTLSTHPSVRQVPTIANNMLINVNAVNCVAQLERMYPISQDLAYNNPLLYYPKDAFADTSTREVLASGGENCGFQIHFHHTNIGTFVNSNTKDGTQINGSIKIEFGAPELPTAPTVGLENIVYYQLILTPDRVPELFYYHPYLMEFRSLPVRGRPFGQNAESTAYSVYVHFAGPVMMVGFGTDIGDWNVYNPIEADEKTESRDKLFYHRIPKDSTIRLTVANMSCTFEYGPMAFNSYHRENVDPTNNPDPIGVQDLPYMNAEFRAPVGRQAYIAPDLINKEMQTNAFVNPDSDETLLTHSPTYYGDWRSQSRAATTPEIYYDGATTPIVDAFGKVTEYVTSGKVRWDTTIEGPIFYHVRSSQDTNRNTASLVTNFQGWGDLSTYMTEWHVTCSSDGHGNLAYVSQTAEVTLVNLAASKLGRRILNLLENSLLAITLGGGFDSNQVFFQGVVESQSTTYEGTESVTKLICRDIQTVLLEGLTFPVPFYFGGTRYQDVIQIVMDLIGLTDYYQLQSKPFGQDATSATGFATFQQALAIRASLVRFNSDLADLTNGLRDANITTRPRDLITNYLQIILDQDTFPVLFYNPATEMINLCWRQDPGLVDSLQFLGQIDDSGKVLLPNSTDESQHGVLKDYYVITTNNRQLHAGMLIFGVLPMSQVITVERRDPSNNLGFFQSIDPQSLVAINNAITNDTEFPDIAYVGFRKFYVDTINTRLIHTRSNLQLVADAIEPLLKSPYQGITFTCYVTHPLSHMGRFVIDTFIGGNRVTSTDYYIYKQVRYDFNKNQNTITATIDGVRLPPVEGVVG